MRNLQLCGIPLRVSSVRFWGLQPIVQACWLPVGSGAERRPEGAVTRRWSAAVKFRGDVVRVAENTVDGVEVLAGLVQAADDTLDGGGRVVVVVVTDVGLMLVGGGEKAGETIDGPGEFAERADHSRQV